MLKNKTIIVGVTGCIAAYKSATIVSRLKDLGADVWVVMTKEAAEFVGPLTFRTLSGNPVIIDLFSKEALQIPVPHISLAQKADLVMVAPCTANLIAKMAQGIADDPLTTIILAATAKKLIAPAMNHQMWNNPAVKENVEKLKDRKVEMIGPAKGKLACGEYEIGRMAEPEEIFDRILSLLVPKQDLKGKTILVTAGGTREAIDPVRYISNRSSGKMGYAIAQAARERGAEVILISANVALPSPLDIKPIKVGSAEEMLSSVMKHYSDSDIIIMAAAVGDYTAKHPTSKSKIKSKSQILNIQLQKTDDILKALSRKKDRKDKIIVGFALETKDLIKNAKIKMKNKCLDLIIANDQTSFDSDTAQVVFIEKNGKVEKPKRLQKREIAKELLNKITRNNF